MAKTKFKKRYILGTGYPFPLGVGPVYSRLCLWGNKNAFIAIELNWPSELWWDFDLPQYRLVLEGVEKDTKK